MYNSGIRVSATVAIVPIYCSRSESRLRTVEWGFHWGKARTLTAIQEGLINKVEFMEKTAEYYVLVGRICTEVYGE